MRSLMTPIAKSIAYDHAFYASHESGSASSAALLVPEVMRIVSPRSVIDVGSGTAEWAAEFLRLGVSDVVAVDGGFVEPRMLKVPVELFTAQDLTNKLTFNRSFDLAISLEVAEHLPPERAEGFVADLVDLAPAVLFSA